MRIKNLYWAALMMLAACNPDYESKYLDPVPAEKVQFNVAQLDQVVDEWDGVAVLEVQLAGKPRSQPVEVQLLFGGTAVRDQDYTVQGIYNRNRISIPAGKNSAQLVLLLADNRVYQARDKQIQVSIVGASDGLPIGHEFEEGRHARITVRDDDCPFESKGRFLGAYVVTETDVFDDSSSYTYEVRVEEDFDNPQGLVLKGFFPEHLKAILPSATPAEQGVIIEVATCRKQLRMNPALVATDAQAGQVGMQLYTELQNLDGNKELLANELQESSGKIVLHAIFFTQSDALGLYRFELVPKKI